MSTVEEITLAIRELPPEKIQIVADFVNSVKDESFKVTRYSPEIMDEINRDLAEARQGLNVEKFDDMEDAIASLGLDEND